MSTQINQDVIKAREVVAGYKELNKGTKEVLSTYDPILRLRVFKKESIDPRSKEFTKLYGKKEKKEKPVKAVKFVAPTIDKTKKKKAVKKVVTKLKKEPKPRYVKLEVDKRKEKVFNPNSAVSKAYELHLQGKSNQEIGLELNITSTYAAEKIRDRKKALGISTAKKKCVNENQVLGLFKKGKTIKQISALLKITESTVYSYLRAEKTEEQRDLEREEVLINIKAKCKIDQSNFIFGKMLTPAKCNYKYSISIMDVYKYCNELAEQGKIIIPDEPIMRYKGRKIELPIA